MAAKQNDEEMSMEEILASIRKYVTDTPPEPKQSKPVQKAEQTKSTTAQSTVQENPPPRPTVMHMPPAAPPPPLAVSPQPVKPSASHHVNVTETMAKAIATPAPEDDDDVLDLIDPLDMNQPVAQVLAQVTPQPQPKPQQPPQAAPVMPPQVKHQITPVEEDIMPHSKSPAQPSGFTSEDMMSLASVEAINRAASAFSRLGESGRGSDKQGARAPMTIDDMVKDIARPLVKQWMDDYLPDIVEEMVQKEIRRITRHMS